MRLADRYIAKNIISGTLYAVLVLSLILILGQLFKEIRPLLVEQRAPISFLGKLIAQFLPFSLMFTLPWGFLVSILLVYGRLSADNELLSLQMTGQSLFRIALPAIALGGLCSLFCFQLVGTLAPRAKNEMKAMLYEAFKDNPKALLEPGIMQSRFKGQKIYVESQGDDELLGLHICQLEQDPKETPRLSSYIHAGQVRLKVDQKRRLLRLKLDQVLTESIDKNGHSQLALGCSAEPWHLDFSGKETKKNLKANRLDNQQLKQALTRKNLPAQLQFSYQTELSKRWSLSLACLAFSFIGVPLGLNAQRKENSRGMMLSIGIAALYFGTMMIGEQIKEGSLWITQSIVLAPLFLSILLGIWLLNRAHYT